MPATASSRPSQKSYTSAKFGDDDAILSVQSAVVDGLILNPKMPAIQLADVLMRESDPDLARALAEILTRKLYVTTILAERRKRSIVAQTRLPGFEHLPLKIRIPRAVPGFRGLDTGKRVSLLDANTYGVREYYRLLMKAHRNRKQNDPKVQEAKSLLEKMQKASRKEKAITVRQVLMLDR